MKAYTKARILYKMGLCKKEFATNEANVSARTRYITLIKYVSAVLIASHTISEVVRFIISAFFF